MMDTQKGHFVFQCDGCDDVLTSGTGNFEAGQNVLRRNGWKAARDGTEWKHFCGDCQPNTRLRLND